MAHRAKRILTASKNFMLLGQCLPTVKRNAVKVAVRRLELDQNLLMYFKEVNFYYAHDPEKMCKHGDIVLIKELREKLTTLITHQVMDVVYPFGDITDPITGKKCVVSVHRDAMEEENQLYGKSDSAFDYERAPPRGWQEGKRDFTDKKTYVKYHEFPVEDPYAV